MFQLGPRWPNPLGCSTVSTQLYVKWLNCFYFKNEIKQDVGFFFNLKMLWISNGKDTEGWRLEAFWVRKVIGYFSYQLKDGYFNNFTCNLGKKLQVVELFCSNIPNWIDLLIVHVILNMFLFNIRLEVENIFLLFYKFLFFSI